MTHHGGCGCSRCRLGGAPIAFIITAIIIAIIVVQCGAAMPRYALQLRDGFAATGNKLRGSRGPEWDSGPEWASEPNWASESFHGGTHCKNDRLYATEDIDPVIATHSYEHADSIRDIYSQRSSSWGLSEFSSSGLPGDVGVDAGPFGIAEYGGSRVGMNDGLPSEWILPDTPVRWYKPAQADHYGPDGPVVYSDGLYSLTEPDHDPLTT